MPGLQDFFSLLRIRGIGFVLVTNNASRTSDSYRNRLASYGIETSANEVLTSAQATAGYLAERSKSGTPVFVIGEEGLQRAVTERGLRLVAEDDQPKYVVVGWDRHLTYSKLAQATLYINAGATFIGTNPDRTWPGERGLLPGAGAILAAVEAATGIAPIVIGKPSPLMLKTAMRRMDARPETTAMLGDRLETDILAGQNAGAITILVLSGVTKREDLVQPCCEPDFVFDDIAALSSELQNAGPTEAN
jgi:4-nitrophenyl phosphatase